LVPIPIGLRRFRARRAAWRGFLMRDRVPGARVRLAPRGCFMPADNLVIDRSPRPSSCAHRRWSSARRRAIIGRLRLVPETRSIAGAWSARPATPSAASSCTYC